MEGDEERVSKISDFLHSNIQKQLRLLQVNSEEVNTSSLIFDLNQFQPAPQLLDSKLNEYIDILISTYLKNESNGKLISEVFYNLGKILGYKKISTFMKTEIHIIPTILTRIKNEGIHWNEQYLLLCWLVVLVLTPFRLDTLQTTIKTDLYQIGLKQLDKLGPLQPFGSRLLGTLVMRVDCQDQLKTFLEVLDSYETYDDRFKVGYLQALNIALQRDIEDVFQPHAMKLSQFCKHITANDQSNTNIELVAKVTSKLGRYLNEMEEFDQIEDIVSFFLDNFSNRNTETRFTLARKYAKLLKSIEPCLCAEGSLDLLNQTEEMTSNPTSFDSLNSDTLHTNLLTIAELLRTKAAPPYNYLQISQIIDTTLFFQQNRVTHIGGSNIRDASNFIAWSMAKYAPQKLEPEITFSVFKDLILVSCFDKDIMIRRASAAALQELMGRHGSHAWVSLYPGSEFNQGRNLCVANILDYVDLGSIEKSYLDMPQNLLAGFPELKEVLVDFLSENCYNLDHDITKLSGKALSKLISQDEGLVQSEITKHITISSKSPFNAFLTLSELLQLTSNHDSLPTIIPIFEGVKIDHHRTPPFQIISYLSLLSSLLILDYQPTEQIMDNLFSSMRIDCTEVKSIITTIAPQLTLSEKYWSEWLHYMKLGNQNASAAVASLKQFQEKCSDILDLLINEKVNYLVKSEILKSINLYLQQGGKFERRYLELACSCLDDYAITEQGDVGSKVRLAAVHLIGDNWERFLDLRDVFEGSLMRLAAEAIESIRYACFKLIQRLNYGISDISHEHNKSLYFERLLSIFKSFYIEDPIRAMISKDFWKGYSFTCGALKSTDELITTSLAAFVKFYQSISNELQSRVILDILVNLKVDNTLKDTKSFKAQRRAKSTQTGIQFLSRALQTNLKLPESFNINGLYVRVYNLHLNTSNLVRMKSAIEIFGYLCIVYRFDDSLQRLKFLIVKHPLARVRVLAAEELVGVYNEWGVQGYGCNEEKLEALKSVDWNQSKGLAKYLDLI